MKQPSNVADTAVRISSEECEDSRAKAIAHYTRCGIAGEIVSREIDSGSFGGRILAGLQTVEPDGTPRMLRERSKPNYLENRGAFL